MPSPLEPDRSAEVKRAMAAGTVHDEWESVYRAPPNERFYEAAFDLITPFFGRPDERPVLDVGCGPGFHAVRLARRGFRVTAADWSPAVLEEARATVNAAGVESAIDLVQADITDLPFPDAAFDRVLCWGVLMHIPEIERALDQIARVTAPGGVLIISERNLRSLEAVLLQRIRRTRGHRDVRASAGVEAWKDTAAGRLMTRTADIGWLTTVLAERGFALRRRLPGQFSEAYAKLPQRLAAAVHALNAFWLHRGAAGPAAGNVLVFERDRLAGPLGDAGVDDTQA